MKKNFRNIVKCFLTTMVMTAVIASTAFAGQWQLSGSDWKYQNDNGSYVTNAWQWIDGNQDGTAECYYFDANGKMYAGTTTPDGYTVDANGAWVVNGVVQTQKTKNSNTTTSATIDTARFKENRPGFVNGGWIDFSTLTWRFFDGGSITIGQGPRFSDIHPEITDPEYYLKEKAYYPGESTTAKNSAGKFKSSYSEKTMQLLQEFLNSFDWIHSTELERMQAVHNRIANGHSGNRDGKSSAPSNVSWKVLETKEGMCNNFGREFADLANLVGLECVAYIPSYMHMACLVKINGVWIHVDPFHEEELYDNTINFPVDFDTEHNRHQNEVMNSEETKKAQSLFELQKQADAGIISWAEYYQAVYPGKTVDEIKAMFKAWGVDLDI